MARIKEDRKILSTAEKEEVRRLEVESDRILDQLFDNPSSEVLKDKLNQIDVKIVSITREKTMEY